MSHDLADHVSFGHQRRSKVDDRRVASPHAVAEALDRPPDGLERAVRRQKQGPDSEDEQEHSAADLGCRHEGAVHTCAAQDHRQREQRQGQHDGVREQGRRRQRGEDAGAAQADRREHLIAGGATGRGAAGHEAAEGVARQLRGGGQKPAHAADGKPEQAPGAHERSRLKKAAENEPRRREVREAWHLREQAQHARPDHIESKCSHAQQDYPSAG